MDLKKHMEFVSAAVKASEGKKRGVAIEFECPLCHAVATVIKSSYNGHRHARCSSCEIGFME